MTSWEEQFDKKFGVAPFVWRGMVPSNYPDADEEVKSFISTEIIEKLIEDLKEIPISNDIAEHKELLDWTKGYNEAISKSKQQLRNKWL